MWVCFGCHLLLDASTFIQTTTLIYHFFLTEIHCILFTNRSWCRWWHRRYHGRRSIEMPSNKDRDQIRNNVSLRKEQMTFIFAANDGYLAHDFSVCVQSWAGYSWFRLGAPWNLRVVFRLCSGKKSEWLSLVLIHINQFFYLRLQRMIIAERSLLWIGNANKMRVIHKCSWKLNRKGQWRRDRKSSVEMISIKSEKRTLILWGNFELK